MGIRNKFEDKIKKKKEEIQQYETKILEAKAYIQALQDTIRYLPKDNKTSETAIRPGSKVSKTLTLLKATGRPMHVTEILKGIGLPLTKNEKTSLSGSLGWYVRRNDIFTRPEPNTFGLINKESVERDEPPDDFGVTEDESEGNEDQNYEVDTES